MIERRAEAEHALREIAARITAIREPGDLLQHVVDEAQRLLRGDGAMIDQFDPDTQTLEWAYDAGIPEGQRQAVKLTSLHLGEGVSGKAVAERRVVRVGDYLAAEDFVHDDLADSLATGADLRDLIAAPIIGEAGPLGAIEVFSRRPNTFDAIDEAVLGGLADQAAIAITNARLIEELEKSRRAVARRADTERSLRDITARIAALREPDVILDRVVEEAARLLGTDGAHLTRMSDDGTYLVPVVVAGGADFDDAGVAARHALPARRRHQRPGRPGGRAGVHLRLPRRPAHPARPGRHRGRRPAGPPRHGRGAAARPGRRGHRHPRRLVDASRARSSPTSWTCCRASPTRPPSRSPTRTSSPASPARRSATATSSRTRRTLSGRSTVRAGSPSCRTRSSG